MIMSRPLFDTLATLIRLTSAVRNAQRHVHQCTIFYAFQKEKSYQINLNPQIVKEQDLLIGNCENFFMHHAGKERKKIGG
jgi:hypothetical protein